MPNSHADLIGLMIVIVMAVAMSFYSNLETIFQLWPMDDAAAGRSNEEFISAVMFVRQKSFELQRR